MKLKRAFNNFIDSYKSTTPLERAKLIFNSLIRIILLVAIVGSIANSRWTVLFVTTSTFILTFVPYFFEKNYKIDIPEEIEIIITLFIFGSLFLGEGHSYYTYYWWWDIILHLGSAITLGFIGFTILYVLYKGNKILAKPSTLAFFSFAFALAFGALWEIFEFSMDQLFGFNMQKSGLMDTMADLIIDTAGALVASLFGYLYIKNKRFFLITGMMKRFVNNNPELFSVRKKK